MKKQGVWYHPLAYARAPARSLFAMTAALLPQGVAWYVSGMTLRIGRFFCSDTTRHELGKYGQAAFLPSSTYGRRHTTDVRQ